MLNEANLNNVDCDLHLIKLNQILYSSQIQDSSETETTQNTSIKIVTDIGLWPENMSTNIDYWTNKDIIHLQNCNEKVN